MSNSKKQVRAKFRNDVYSRDKYSCRCCGKKFDKDTAQENLDAHHITPREDFDNGGYVGGNGISLCKLGEDSCHLKAESVLKGNKVEGFEPQTLYNLIGSSLEKAIREDKSNK